MDVLAAVVAEDVQIAPAPALPVPDVVVVPEPVKEAVPIPVQENAIPLVQQKRRQKSLPILERILLSAICIKATEYLQLKSAIDQEYIRRGKQAPEGFLQTPQAKGNVLLSTAQKIMDDVYALDNEPEHDWRGVFQSGTVVPPI